MTNERSTTDQRTDKRYACIRNGDGEYILYDQENPNGWIQSDTTYPLA
ncbi:MAG: hypothetical protein ABEH86_00415 [Haloarcula sp.]